MKRINTDVPAEKLTSDIKPETKKDIPQERAFALFSVAQESYCVDLDSIFEILHDFAIMTVSHLPEFFEGVINLRGETIPVVNLRNLLNLASDKTDFPVCIITQSSEGKTGYLVDSDIEIIRSSECQFFPLPDCFTHDEQKFLEGIIEYKNRLFGIIKLEQALKTITERRSENEDK
ncbi:MAG: chemotaxis protein CheW [candidate division WOR-3 bacterium]|nr:chemotaxis protein CheW [candidate division WOR-3 bacterium]